jgi:hypothetical protein
MMEKNENNFHFKNSYSLFDHALTFNKTLTGGILREDKSMPPCLRLSHGSSDVCEVQVSRSVSGTLGTRVWHLKT